MRVLILSQYFWPETFRITEVAQSLREAGCEVTVLTGQPNYPDGVVFEGYDAFGIGREEHAGCEVYRVPLAPRGRAGALRLAFNYLSFVFCAGVLGPFLLRRRKFDVIFVYGISPILQAVPGLVLRRTTGAALVVWVQDLWPQSLEVTGFLRNRRALGLVASVVRWIYRRSDLLLVQSQGFVAEVAAMAGDTPVEYHPNPGELAFSAPPAATPPALVLQPGFNIVFAGNLGTVQALDTVLAAAALLSDLADTRFVLIGAGSRQLWLQERVKQLGLTNVQMAGRFAPEQMPGILAQASALLVSLVRSPIMSQTIPSKVQAYLAAGRPVIASLDGEGARVIMEAGAGIACPAEDAEALAAAVRELQRTSTGELELMSQNARAYYEANFEPKGLAVRLERRFAQLVGRGRSANIHGSGRTRTHNG
jgi:glycosyltransferase involved in cell wall biosynthesis